ncbi:hypothetical protein L596_017483 [Steinernema carpocapsae]|uniref:Major sperm protein n=1 Tax=Steinernema carpocapsae TaxID=34508 RepID=A0A4U5N1T6_STECR|nr:hypothetical protein L596_017483 [Steinernema carpocapsae]
MNICVYPLEIKFSSAQGFYKQLITIVNLGAKPVKYQIYSTNPSAFLDMDYKGKVNPACSKDITIRRKDFSSTAREMLEFRAKQDDSPEFISKFVSVYVANGTDKKIQFSDDVKVPSYSRSQHDYKDDYEEEERRIPKSSLSMYLYLAQRVDHVCLKISWKT